jgi:GNAT superfamily N-acetyltransferase
MEVLDIGGLDGTRFSAAHELRMAIDRRLDPAQRPTTREELRLEATVDRTDNARHDRVVAFDDPDPVDDPDTVVAPDDRAVALGHLELGHDTANPGFCSAEIDVADGRIDAGHAVLAELLDRAEADGRTSLLGWGPHNAEQTAFWTGLGATERYTERVSDLDLAAVDEGLMQRWIDARTERAGDIRMVHWNGACPPEHLNAFVVARNAINDAPLGDIEIHDEVFTAESTSREFEAFEAVGWEIQALLALDPSGEAAALTTVCINGHRPEASWQGDTAVLDHQRRRGIGRWIKAEMWRRLRANRPDITHLRTGNAESNDAMLAINVAMGYEPVHVMAGWQAEIRTIRASLAET